MPSGERPWREFRYPDGPAFAAGVANVIADPLRAALSVRARASLVVPGGSTPGPVFNQLAHAEIDWARVDITLSDERWVSSTHADSNEALVRSHLLQGRAASARFQSLYRPTALPSAAVAEVAQALQQLTRPLDVVLLGLGDDGHFASLFPARPELAAALDINSSGTVVALDEPALGRPRISLTLPALCNARRVMLALQGEHKRAVVQRALESGPVEMLPVRALLRQTVAPLELHWSSTGAANQEQRS